MTIQEILKDSTIEGNVLKLPLIQLDRKDYCDVKKSLELIGGKWKSGERTKCLRDIRNYQSNKTIH
jgi:hypothetical protein